MAKTEFLSLKVQNGTKGSKRKPNTVIEKYGKYITFSLLTKNCSFFYATATPPNQIAGFSGGTTDTALLGWVPGFSGYSWQEQVSLLPPPLLL